MAETVKKTARKPLTGAAAIGPGPGRPKGSKNKATADIRALAGQYGEQAVKALVSIATDPTHPAAARVSAANALLDRGFGKPSQAVELSGPAGGPIKTEAEPMDFSALSNDELEALERLLAKTSGEG